MPSTMPLFFLFEADIWISLGYPKSIGIDQKTPKQPVFDSAWNTYLYNANYRSNMENPNHLSLNGMVKLSKIYQHMEFKNYT